MIKDKKLLNGNDNIIKLTKNKLNDKSTYEETLLYLFEKNSLIFYNYFLKKQKEL